MNNLHKRVIDLHRKYYLSRLNDIKTNYITWNAEYGWPEDGNEWSHAWGSKDAQWQASILPRIAPWLPARSILEIAPGHGRWSKFLIQQAGLRYRGVDLADSCVAFCKKCFVKHNNAEFFTNDGQSLSMIEDQSCDFVFSFDSLVHVEWNVLKNYIAEILRVLKRDSGMAFLHHSNAGEHYGDCAQIPGWRARDVTASQLTDFIENNQTGGVWVQEKINWEGAEKCCDCLTLFSTRKCLSPVFMENTHFMDEAQFIKAYINYYYVVS
jgi:SAM-dependent methyltransferase